MPAIFTIASVKPWCYTVFMTITPPKKPYTAQLELEDALQAYKFTFPPATKRFTVRPRNEGLTILHSYDFEGLVGDTPTGPYSTIRPKEQYYEDGLLIQSNTELWFKCLEASNVILEITYWL